MNALPTTASLMRNFRRGVAALAVAGLATSANAAIISWTVFDTLGASDVSTQGSLIQAVNMGQGANATVNGVLFAATDALLEQSSGDDFLNTASSSDTEYDKLLGSLDFGRRTGSADSETDTTLTIAGLTVGRSYILQTWFTDLRSCCSARVMLTGDGNGNTASLAATGANQLGQYAVGSFVADAATQALRLTTVTAGRVHLNGFQVREVPAPATLALFALGLFGLRRKLAA